MSFNVLIVDDSHAMREVIKKIITLSGFKMDKCLESANGLEALETLKREWVDIIISDINMPEMNGMELLRRLKQDELYREIPVVMISTEGSNVRVEEAFALGARGFIKKPFLPEELRKQLYDVLGVSSDGEYPEDRGDAPGIDF